MLRERLTRDGAGLTGYEREIEYLSARVKGLPMTDREEIEAQGLLDPRDPALADTASIRLETRLHLLRDALGPR